MSSPLFQVCRRRPETTGQNTRTTIVRYIIYIFVRPFITADHAKQRSFFQFIHPKKNQKFHPIPSLPFPFLLLLLLLLPSSSSFPFSFPSPVRCIVGQRRDSRERFSRSNGFANGRAARSPRSLFRTFSVPSSRRSRSLNAPCNANLSNSTYFLCGLTFSRRERTQLCVHCDWEIQLLAYLNRDCMNIMMMY